MPLGTGHITKTTADVFIPELWTAEVIESASRRSIMADIVMRFDEVAKDGGDKINIPKITDLVANPKLSEQQVILQATTEDSVVINLDKHLEVSFLIEDIVSVQAKGDLRKIYTQKAGEAIAKAVDIELLKLYSEITQQVGSAGSTEDLDESLVSAINYLDEADAPTDDRFIVIHPDVKKAMLSIDKFIHASYRSTEGPAPAATGAFGEIYGCKVFVSNNVCQTGEAPNITTHNLIFQKGAFALAIQMGPRVQGNYVAEYLGTLVTVDVIFGCAVLRPDYAVVLLS